MATGAFTLQSERWLDQITLYGAISEGAGDISDTYTLPAGIGDLALVECIVFINTVATMMTNPEIHGPTILVTSPAGGVVDIVGVSRWVKTSATQLAAYFSPDPLVMVRQHERLLLVHVDVDVHASPTPIANIHAKFVRVRPLEAPASPIQLVR